MNASSSVVAWLKMSTFCRNKTLSTIVSIRGHGRTQRKRRQRNLMLHDRLCSLKQSQAAFSGMANHWTVARSSRAHDSSQLDQTQVACNIDGDGSEPSVVAGDALFKVGYTRLVLQPEMPASEGQKT